MIWNIVHFYSFLGYLYKTNESYYNIMIVWWNIFLITEVIELIIIIHIIKNIIKYFISFIFKIIQILLILMININIYDKKNDKWFYIFLISANFEIINRKLMEIVYSFHF